MSFLVRALVVILALLGISVLFRQRRKQHPHDGAVDGAGRGPDSAALAGPDAVELGTDVPAPDPVEKWEDVSKRRKLPRDEYRAAADQPETDPEPLS